MTSYVCLKMHIRDYITHDLCGQLTVYVYNDVNWVFLFYLCVCVIYVTCCDLNVGGLDKEGFL